MQGQSSLRVSLHPMPSSSEDSRGVPQRRQMTAEQSPQVKGSRTSIAQTGQYRVAAGFSVAGVDFGVLSKWLSPAINNRDEDETVTQSIASPGLSGCGRGVLALRGKARLPNSCQSVVLAPGRAGMPATTQLLSVRRIAMFLIHFQARIEFEKNVALNDRGVP